MNTSFARLFAWMAKVMLPRILMCIGCGNLFCIIINNTLMIWIKKPLQLICPIYHYTVMHHQIPKKLRSML